MNMDNTALGPEVSQGSHLPGPTEDELGAPLQKSTLVWGLGRARAQGPCAGVGHGDRLQSVSAHRLLASPGQAWGAG